MNVVLLLESGRVAGGADRVAFDSGAGLVARGHRVRLVSAAGEVDPAWEASGIETRAMDLHSVYESPDRLRRLTGNPDAPAAIGKALEGLDPKETVVHVHTFGLEMTWTAIAGAQRLGFPTVLTAHEYATGCPTALWFDHRGGYACPRRPLGLACVMRECSGHGVKHRLPRLLHASAANKVRVHARHAAAIYPSDAARRTLAAQRSRLLEAPIQRVLPNPQSLPEASPVRPSDHDVFTVVGRITAEKGVGPFFAICRELGVKSRAVGDGPLAPELKSAFPEADFTGWLGPAEVAAALRSSRAYVLPSLWRETMGLTVLEAAAHGLPSIAPRESGAGDWIDATGGGLTFEDAASLREAISRLRDGSTADEFGNRAHAALAADPPTLDRHLDGLEEIYRAALSSNRR